MFEQINLVIKLDNKIICAQIDKNAQIKKIYDMIFDKTQLDLSKSHILLFNSRILLPDKIILDYCVNHDMIINVMFSAGKFNTSKPTDILGIKSYCQLLEHLVNDNPNDLLIVSLLSSNICEDSYTKNLQQQIQPASLIKLINQSTQMSLIKLNIVLTDTDFIGYPNSMSGGKQIVELLEMDLDSTHDFQTQYVSKWISTKQSTKFILNHCGFYSSDLINKISINYYLVGVTFDTLTNQNNVICGIDHSPYINPNSIITMWTGEVLSNNWL
jgi:hypothetical protein